MDDGFYLIRSDSDKSTIGIFRESTNTEKSDVFIFVPFDLNTTVTISFFRFDIDLQSDWFRGCNDNLDTRSLWMPINPECVLQWHRIKKRVPATFEPREGKKDARNFFNRGSSVISGRSIFTCLIETYFIQFFRQ